MVLFACTLHGKTNQQFLGHEWQRQQMSYHPFCSGYTMRRKFNPGCPKTYCSSACSVNPKLPNRS
jgi:hypothetical protein